MIVIIMIVIIMIVIIMIVIIMIIASYTNDDDRHHDVDCIVHR